jgi:hypothetical protein
MEVVRNWTDGLLELGVVGVLSLSIVRSFGMVQVSIVK